MENNHRKNFLFLEKYFSKNNLPLELIPLESGFCVAIRFLTIKNKETFQKIKEIFAQEGLLVQFSDNFYDFKNYWFRIIISTDLTTIKKIAFDLMKIFKKLESESQ